MSRMACRISGRHSATISGGHSRAGGHDEGGRLVGNLSRNQTRRFWESGHQVEVLNSDSRRSLNEIVECGQDGDHAFRSSNRDVAVVGLGDVLRRGQVIDDIYERLACVEVPHCREQFCI